MSDDHDSHDRPPGGLRPHEAAELLAEALSETAWEGTDLESADEHTPAGGTDVTFDMLPAAGETAGDETRAEDVARLLENSALRRLLADASAAEGEAETAVLPAAVRAAALDAFARSTAEAAAAEGDEVPAPELLEADLIEDVRVAETASRTPAAVLSPGVRAAALAAFELAAQPAAVDPARDAVRGGRRRAGTTPLRSRRLRPLVTPRAWAAVAAVLVVLLGAGIFLGGSSDTAEAGLQLASLKRIDRAGATRMSQVEPRYFAQVGQRFEPAPDELLAFGFSTDAHLIAGGGDALRVARDGDGGEPLFRLDSGEVLLSTKDRPVALLVDGAGLLVLLDGAAHVAVDEAGGPAVALPPGSEARFTGRDGRTVSLAGPATGLLSADGPGDFGQAARSLFDELQFFGGALPRGEQTAPVAARTCGVGKVRGGTVRRGRHALEILAPVGTADAQQGVQVELTWQPRPWLADATEVRVHLRAPAGSRVTAPAVGADGAAVSATAGAAALASEPGLAVVALQLAPGWYERLDGAPLVLRLEVPAASEASTSQNAFPNDARDHAPTRRRARVAAWFDGLTLVLGSEIPVPGAAEEDPRRE